MSLPPVSVLIPSCNRPQMLHDTVCSILEGNEIPGEIIIIDQSKAVHPVLSAFQPDRYCRIHYVHSDVPGSTRAINAGVDLAQNDLIVIANEDIFVEKTWLSELIQALLDVGPRGAVAGRVLRYGLKRSRMQKSVDIIYMAGLISGAGTWLLTQRKTQ